MIPEEQASEKLGTLSVDDVVPTDELCKCPVGCFELDLSDMKTKIPHTVTDCYDMRCDCCGTEEYSHDEKKLASK